LGGGSARRKSATYAGQHKHSIKANIHSSSGTRTHDVSVGGEKTVYTLERAATVIDFNYSYVPLIMNLQERVKLLLIQERANKEEREINSIILDMQAKKKKRAVPHSNKIRIL
jgi:hypothetical protein